MPTLKSLFPLGLAAALLLVGCQGGDDGLNQPNMPTDNGGSVVRGDIASSSITFEFTSQVDRDWPNPPPGPFLIRGHNVSYDPDLGALVVDLTVVNASPRAYPEPVSLTFLQILPANVTVLNADNGESGVGAAFLFQFTNDDAMWTPGEESLPRAVQFEVAAGVSVGFAARIDVGMDPLGGAIGGLIWHDADEDGLVDPDEPGIGGIGVRIQAAANQHWLTTTAANGIYRVDGLPAGYYTVERLPRPGLRPTTPPQLQVLLVEDQGSVPDFLVANFGCRIVDPDISIQVGDCVHVKGEYAASPDRLIASNLCLCDQEDEDDEDKDDDSSCWNRLTGPATAVNPQRSAVAIMGTWLRVAADANFDLSDLEIGDRVRANVAIVMENGSHHLEACRLHSFDGRFDRIRGVVQEVFPDANGHITAVRILDTMVVLGNAEFGCDD